MSEIWDRDFFKSLDPYYKKNKSLTIKVNEDFLNKLDEICYYNGRTNKSEIIREAVTRYYLQTTKNIKEKSLRYERKND